MKSRVRRSLFRCQQCGAARPRWQGKCDDCGAWNTLAEETAPSMEPPRRLTSFSTPVTPLALIQAESALRRMTGLSEFDRVLGGGLWPGSLILLGGAPGIGKSTLMLHAADRLARAGEKVLYVSGEESLGQVKGRADRLGVKNDSLLLLSETSLENILDAVREHTPTTVIIDSVQTVYKSELSGTPGSVGQIRECAAEFLHLAKGMGITVFLLGHVTKEGDLAGPRVLEHMVDTVLYFETERHDVHRVLRAVKNRFGPTNEIGVFEMTGQGLAEVTNPSLLFLGEHDGPGPAGTAVVGALEGSRPLLVEVQALVTRTLFGMPRRQAAGVEYNRAMILMAVLDKRCGFHFESQDVYVSTTGGLDVKEPAADLGLAAAMASAARERPVPPKTLWLGEAGLGGELRPVAQAAERLEEARRLGFTHAVLPDRQKGARPPSGMTLITARTLSEALEKTGLS
jgi:DNA repair protein RadA/Sms